MNIVLWIVQVLLGVAFLIGGIAHGFRYEQMKVRQKWMVDVPRSLTTFIGICEILGAIGLILPALTGILTWLTPLAGASLAVMMLLAVGFHLMRREYPIIVNNIVLLALTAFVAYGRWLIAPL